MAVSHHLRYPGTKSLEIPFGDIIFISDILQQILCLRSFAVKSSFKNIWYEKIFVRF